MQSFLFSVQIIFSVLFSILILVQPRGAGLGRAFGGGGSSFTRRGVEKALFKFTFIIAGLFIITSVLGLAF